jgi:peptide subunit release factor 1 (eRF1)
MSTSQTLMARFPQAAGASLPDEMLERMLGFQPQTMPVISLYLDTRANEHGKRTFDPFVRKRLTEVARTFDAHSPERNSFDEDFVRIERYLEDEPRPSAQGLAIFACSAANDFFDVGQFEVPFERNRLHVSDRPQLYPLARLASESTPYAVVTADTNSAHIFVLAAGRVLDRRDIQNVDREEPRWRGLTANRFQSHTEDFQHRHAKEVVQVLERTTREDKIEKVILSGDHETIIPLLRAQMSKELASKVIDELSLGVNAVEREILEESGKVLQRHRSLDNQSKITRLLNEYRADDLGVVGAVQTLAALSNGQVEELLISARPEDLAYDAVEIDNVLKLYQTDDQPIPETTQRSVADELVRRANQLSSARVTFVENASDASQLKQVGGVGALLRYRISAEHATPYEQSDAVARTEALIET